MAPLRWNTTGITVTGTLNCTNATSNCLNYPIGIAVDSSGSVYVADTNNHRIQKFLSGNITGTTVAGFPTGSSGNSASHLNTPNDVAVDSNGNIYVVDTGNNRAQLWYANASAGITIVGNGK
jgi:sugar lactone lactonase YvrE